MNRQTAQSTFHAKTTLTAALETRWSDAGKPGFSGVLERWLLGSVGLGPEFLAFVCMCIPSPCAIPLAPCMPPGLACTQRACALVRTHSPSIGRPCRFQCLQTVFKSALVPAGDDSPLVLCSFPSAAEWEICVSGRRFCRTEVVRMPCYDTERWNSAA